MDYTETYHLLKSQFNPALLKTEFRGSDIGCYMTGFVSGNVSRLAEERDRMFHHPEMLNTVADEEIPENRSFSYPVIGSSAALKKGQAILLLHGLNERSWIKYLSWAYYLAEKTGRAVILFPIAFHMNRSPEAWGNPRLMSSLLSSRRQKLGEVPMSTFANVALSERLCEDPLRFFTSGQQSAADLVQLTRQLAQGEHPLFKQNTSVDVFAYSIGAFLAQILFLGNPGGIYDDSRLFLFCGGALFDQMDGVSKLIMDQQAFASLRQYYINDLPKETERSDELANSLHQTRMGQSFLSMLSLNNLKTYREHVFQKMKKQIHAVAMLRDKVIPAAGIMESLSRWVNVEMTDFPYAYSHEIPFPVNDPGISDLVDRSFNAVFSKAAAFLA